MVTRGLAFARHVLMHREQESAQPMRNVWFWVTTVIAIVAVLAGGIALLTTMLHIVSGR